MGLITCGMCGRAVENDELKSQNAVAASIANITAARS